MAAFEKTVRKFTNFLCYVAVFMLALLVLIGTIDVVGRYFFNTPIKGALEGGEILLAGIVLFGLAYTLATESHVRVDTFVVLFHPRMQAKIGVVMSAVSFVLFGLIGWQGAEVAIQSWERQRAVDVLNIPVAPFQFFVTLGALAVCLELLVEMRKQFNAAKRES
jgi:TRAP-type C4-dicarboxylate transport system permease small subunit